MSEVRNKTAFSILIFFSLALYFSPFIGFRLEGMNAEGSKPAPTRLLGIAAGQSRHKDVIHLKIFMQEGFTRFFFF